MAKPIQVKRSGFLSQIFYGKQSYAARPPRIFEDFKMTMLALADTSIDSHQVLVALENEQTEDGKLPSGTASHILKIQPKEIKEEEDGAASKENARNENIKKENARNENTKKENVKKAYITGVGPFASYYKHVGNKTPDVNTNFYETFSTSREILFGGILKSIDDLVRLPAVTFAAGQLLLERTGWKLQVLYRKTDNIILKTLSGIFFTTTGFLMNATGAIVCGLGVFVSKVAAEAVRVPLAITGGTIGLIFGGIVSIFQNILTQGTNNYSQVKSVANSLFQGMLDGIRPFAPEFANNLQRINIQIEMPEAKIRWPFETLTGTFQGGVVNPPWTSITMFTLSLIAVVVMSTVNIGMDKPLLEHLFDLTRVAEGGNGPGILEHFTFMKLNSTLTTTTFATFTLMAIGGLQAALVGVARGFKAFFNDLMYAEGENKAERAIIVAPAPRSPITKAPQGSADDVQPGAGSPAVTFAAPASGATAPASGATPSHDVVNGAHN